MISTWSWISDVTSVTYTNVASASPKATLLADALTFASRLTMLSRTYCSKFSPYSALALDSTSLAYSAIGTPSWANTSFTPGFARSCSCCIPAGLSLGTITTGRFLAKVCGSDTRSSSTAVSIFASSAEAKTSAGAPCSSWVSSSELPPKLVFRSVSGFCSSKVLSSSPKASVSEEAASTVSVELSASLPPPFSPSEPPPHPAMPKVSSRMKSRSARFRSKRLVRSNPKYVPLLATSLRQPKFEKQYKGSARLLSSFKVHKHQESRERKLAPLRSKGCNRLHSPNCRENEFSTFSRTVHILALGDL